ncbi:MAG: VOC family protein [Planctomycetota bacterium]|nr:VOC family protein [Planctomycetota bacterium]
MRIEHIALNVADPLSTGRWYVENLGFTVKRRVMEAPWAQFLADDAGSMLEIYGNEQVPVPDYAAADPMIFHIALLSRDMPSDVARLKAAGATVVSEPKELSNGDEMAMLRDPWGIPLQLINRAEPMV